MEAVVAMNASVSFINGNRLRSPSIQKVCFPSGACRRGTLSCFTTRAALEGDEGSKKSSIRLTIQAETPGQSEPSKLVIEVPDHEQVKHEDVKKEDVRESVMHVASESAVESPERVHEEAEHEAGAIASKTGEAVEEVTENLEKTAERASEVEAEHLGSGSESPVAGLGQELHKNVEGAVKASLESGQKARQGLEAARGEVEKRVSVLVEAAEEAGQRGNKVVEAAKKSLEELKNRLGGVQESASRAAGDVQKNVGELQRKIEQQAQQGSSGVEKLRSEAERGAESLELDPEKHKAVDAEDVNKDGERKLAEEHWQSEKDDPEGGGVVSETIKEFVDPALEGSAVGREVREEDEIGDGNEHLKNMKDLVLHDSYAPIDDSDDHGGKSD
ncbi:suprabasin isoform X1 [Selaginella moellendorffii]|uniref:suprabasin isoform X1 n=1 Tax=Selaginella moellendorffii TaxID=88036 RepID=UPI000D1C590D|nr:suprabasin isoform X1 [Selaginella moellendorffii]|eukprot:XP_024533481.1 suprabasin isoform X1 [Selaginella moellendorffii]